MSGKDFNLAAPHDIQRCIVAIPACSGAAGFIYDDPDAGETRPKEKCVAHHADIGTKSAYLDLFHIIGDDLFPIAISEGMLHNNALFFV